MCFTRKEENRKPFSYCNNSVFVNKSKHAKHSLLLIFETLHELHEICAIDKH